MNKELRIVIIEDDADFAEMVRDIAESEIEINNLNASVEKIEKDMEVIKNNSTKPTGYKYNLYIIDHQFSKYRFNGHDIAEIIREREKTTKEKNFIIIFSSFNQQLESFRRKLNIFDYIPKSNLIESEERLREDINKVFHYMDI